MFALWKLCLMDPLLAGNLSGLASQRKWKLTTEELPHSYVDLPRTWTEYLGKLASDFRPLLTRYPRRLQSRFSVDISRLQKAEDLASGLQTLFTLHQMRWTGRGEPGAFADPQRRDFYSRMASAFLQRGWLEFWSLRLENETVATQFCFRYRDTVSLLQEGFHPRYTAEKVGYALRAHALQEMISTGARRYDFLGGADAYKARFGSTQGSYLNLYFAGPSWKGRLVLMARQRSRALKAWLKTHLPQRVLAALQRRSKIIAGQRLTGVILECLTAYQAVSPRTGIAAFGDESATLGRKMGLWNHGFDFPRSCCSTFP